MIPPCSPISPSHQASRIGNTFGFGVKSLNNRVRPSLSNDAESQLAMASNLLAALAMQKASNSDRIDRVD